MSIPSKCTVLVIGGGPGGSYTASALAREGIDTVVLEADVFPRYHVGESMVPSLRHFLRFIDLDTTFNNHGFIQKTGAAFKLNKQKDAYTNFLVSRNDDSHAWNVIRSESDELMFKHAGKCGAKIFDGVKVGNIEFTHLKAEESPMNSKIPNLGRPVSAAWSRKDGTSGEIKFDYLVDASGRAGIISTKYLKNRSFNSELKNVASWGYWKGAMKYGAGTYKEGQPFFEALADGSGWAWLIPLHNNTTSVGIVMDQAKSIKKKKLSESPSAVDFYKQSIQEAVGVAHYLSKAELVTEIKHASDWSYNASAYATPYIRIVGDAGAFIDPYFSSGVHLALGGALTAAVTISASIRGDCTEELAYRWHSKQVAERYTRFLLVVLSATKQIRHQDEAVLNESGEDGFDNAFSIIRSVIQGIADVPGKATEEEINKTVNFTTDAIARGAEEEAPQVTDPTGALKEDHNGRLTNSTITKEQAVLKRVRHVFEEALTVDSSDGFVANLKVGSLGLIPDIPASEISVQA